MEAPAQTRSCVACGRQIQWDANVCPYCGHDYRQQMQGTQPMMPMMPMAPPPKPQTAIPIVAGILLLVSGLIWIVEAILIILSVTSAVSWGLSWIPVDFVGMFGALAGIVTTIVIAFAAIGIIFAIIAIIGGIFATQRKHAGLAILGSIFCLFAIGPFGIASILALVALIMFAVSHEEFK